ncbi:MAG: RIO1 family regulatory kinase/ATPase, partial [Planctomycetota bacterium]
MGNFTMQLTYAGGRAERAYLHDCLSEFFEDQLLTDILAKVKGGKEANVYCCLGKDDRLIAAKIYRPPEFRAMKNDWVYRLGRGETDATGKAARDSREQRAMANRTRFGKELRSGSWIYSEVAALNDCYDAGVCVPQLIAHSERVLLMQYLGDDDGPAPM